MARRGRFRALPVPLAAILLLTLAGCGGSGGGGPTAPRGLTVDAVESRSFELLNGARGRVGEAPLAFDEAAAAVARAHSEAMRDQGFFGHVDPQRGDLGQRLAATAIVFSVAAENLAAVEHDADPAGFAHAHLMDSPGHRQNILDPRFSEVGVGVARAGDGYWITQIFLGR